MGHIQAAYLRGQKALSLAGQKFCLDTRTNIKGVGTGQTSILCKFVSFYLECWSFKRTWLMGTFGFAKHNGQSWYGTPFFTEGHVV